VLDRYLLRELLLPFLFGIGLFAAIGISVGSLFELVRRVTDSGLPWQVAAEVLLLRVPQFVAYAFPMATLLASLMAYSRLSSDSELVAMRSIGIGTVRLIAPAIALGLIVTGLTFLFNELIVPAANQQASTTLERALDREDPGLQKRNILFAQYREAGDGGQGKVLSRLFYAERFDGERMRGLTVLDRSQQSVRQIVSAQSATWNPAQNRWDFYDGTNYLIAADESFRNIVRFEHQALDLPKTPLKLAQTDRDADEMSWAQARERLQTLRGHGSERELRKLRVRIHQKVSLPFACFIFGFLGAALGVKPPHAGRGTSFGISILVVFGYYVVFSLAGALAQVGTIPPLLGAWVPNLLGLSSGGYLLLRAAR